MDVEEILAKIRAFCEERTRESSVIRKAREKIAGGKATYAEAQKVAMEEGRILEEAFTKYLPEALTNGYLYREFAEKLVKVPVRDQAKEVTNAAEDVQEALNEAAGIGIRPIVPELNREQLDGIVTGICNENFERGKSEFFSQVENFLEGHVDDFVRENADFQYKSGLSPKIERIANAKCCDWCSRMAGIYNYADVSDQGNDVFRRHKNCHCLVTYNPGNGSKRRQDVYTKRWTDGEKADRIRFAEANQRDIVHQRLPKSELKNGLPIKGVPDSISDMVDENGKVLQRRKYGEDGRAKVDYDTADHGETWKHPTGAHKHTFDYSTGKPKRSRKDVPFTIEELEENADIIVPGVNYFADKRIH